VKEGEEGKGRERRVWGWALALSVSGRRTHLNTPSFGNGSTPLATSIVHSKLDYCNSLYYNLPQSQIKGFQNIQNSLARAVTRTLKSSHITFSSQISTLVENKRTHEI